MDFGQVLAKMTDSELNEAIEALPRQSFKFRDIAQHVAEWKLVKTLKAKGWVMGGDGYWRPPSKSEDL